MQRKGIRQIRMNARRQYTNERRFAPPVLLEETEEQTFEDNSVPCPDFEPGLIVKIVLDEPISDAKRFKVFPSFNNVTCF